SRSTPSAGRTSRAASEAQGGGRWARRGALERMRGRRVAPPPPKRRAKTVRRLVAFATLHPRPVLAAALLAAIAGELGRRALPGAVVPDVSDPQIALVADWMGHPADEVERRVTRVLTAALQGVDGVTAVRGSSMTGMAYLDVAFASTDRLAA